MPAKYHPVSPAVWDRKFRQLSEAAKVVAFYVWSCPQRTSEGFYKVSVAYIVADTGLAEPEVMAALKELEEANYVEYDVESETVLDRLALRFNPIHNGRDKQTDAVMINKRLPGALRQLHHVVDSPLFLRFVALAESLSPDLAAAIREEFPDCFQAPMKPLASPSQGGFREESESSSYEERRVEAELRGVAL